MEKETDDFKIVGGKKLHGTIETNTSKNGALGLFCASLLNKQPTTLHGIPRIEEISSIIKIFESIDTNASSRIRSILMMIGALIHHEKNFQIPHAGGCKMGQRTIPAHKYGLEML